MRVAIEILKKLIDAGADSEAREMNVVIQQLNRLNEAEKLRS